jgi:hypothetical protein
MSDEKIQTAFGPVTPAATFVPLNYGQLLVDQMFDNSRRMIRHWDISLGIDPDNHPTTMEERDVDPAWLKARKKFRKEWRRIVKQGLREGWLEHDHCYECGGELKVTTNTTEWVKVPNPDYDPDKPNPYAKEETPDDRD